MRLTEDQYSTLEPFLPRPKKRVDGYSNRVSGGGIYLKNTLCIKR